MTIAIILCWAAMVIPACAPALSESLPQQDTVRASILQEVNDLRTKGCTCGSKRMPPVAPVTWNEKLAAAAQRHASDMARNGHFDHTGTDGSTNAQRVVQAGYQWRAVAENIAYGYQTPAAVVAGWVKSTGHCQNMMSAAYTEMGAAREGVYWVQTFGTAR